MKIISDQELTNLITMKEAIDAVETAIIAKTQGRLVTPPRFSCENDHGSLVFTVGGYKDKGVIGFRVYDTFDNDGTGHSQVVAVYDSQSGIIKGLVLGNRLGIIRTGAIGGVALKYLSRKDSKTLGIIGTGHQARSQLRAALEVRDIKTIRVFGRNAENKINFSKEMQKELEIDVIPVDSPKDAVIAADILICATSSSTPVFDPDWLSPGVHTTTLGPKSREKHEISPDLSKRSDFIVTDSLSQLEGYAKPYFIEDQAQRNRIRELGEWIINKPALERTSQARTLFCSVGLSGTEVVVADRALSNLNRKI